MEKCRKLFDPEQITVLEEILSQVKLWEKHQGTSLEEAKKMLSESHAQVMKLAEKYSEDELFTKGAFKWTGTSTLGSYFISNTSSHYNWAVKKLKAHIKNCRTK